MDDMNDKDFKAKETYLYVWLPMQYDEDSSTIEYIMEQGQVPTPTRSNINNIIKFCRRMLERRHWQEMAGKVILFQMEDD